MKDDEEGQSEGRWKVGASILAGWTDVKQCFGEMVYVNGRVLGAEGYAPAGSLAAELSARRVMVLVLYP